MGGVVGNRLSLLLQAAAPIHTRILLPGLSYSSSSQAWDPSHLRPQDGASAQSSLEACCVALAWCWPSLCGPGKDLEAPPPPNQLKEVVMKSQPAASGQSRVKVRHEARAAPPQGPAQPWTFHNGRAGS